MSERDSQGAPGSREAASDNEDSAIPQNDRSFLADTPPAQLDSDAIQAYEDTDDAGDHDGADAART